MNLLSATGTPIGRFLFFGRAPLFATLVLLAATAGCSSIGPSSVPRDRSDYLKALATSWKTQMLSNVVNIRYGEPPSFLDVASIVSSYSLDTNVSIGVTSNTLSTAASSQLPWSATVVGAGASYQDRPTISYTPLIGDRFTKRLIRPIPPAGIFELIQSGLPADVVLQMTVRSLNGIKNQGISGGTLEPADPEFYPLLDALRRLQNAGRLSVRTEKRGTEEVGVLTVVEGRTPEVARDFNFVRDTLRARPDKDGDLLIVFAPTPRSGRELAVLSRSMGDILLDLAWGIDVPAEHVASGRTLPTVRVNSSTSPRDRPMVKIDSGTAPPANAFAAVEYGNTWYWIDDNDFNSKRSFTLMMIFTALAETGVVPQVPALTLPVR
ncbi:MAG: hypothetical protein IBJ17_00510 [Reyranella sp.]|nr:hypothetical protein [Reyranella sp.]